MLFHLSTISGCFSSSAAEVRSHKRDHKRPLAQSAMYEQKMFAAPVLRFYCTFTKALQTFYRRYINIIWKKRKYFIEIRWIFSLASIFVHFYWSIAALQCWLLFLFRLFLLFPLLLAPPLSCSSFFSPFFAPLFLRLLLPLPCHSFSLLLQLKVSPTMLQLINHLINISPCVHTV